MATISSGKPASTLAAGRYLLSAKRDSLRSMAALIRLAISFLLVCTGVYLVDSGAEYGRQQGWGLQPNSVATLELPGPGINIDLMDVENPARRAALERLQAHGFGWVRQRVDWGRIEPQPGIYQWEALDATLDEIVAADLTPLLVLDGSPPWARAPQDRQPTANPLAPPADPTDFARFARSVARRYGDRLRFYQLWDEPNIAPHWGNRHIEPVHYAQLARLAAEAIRSADPDAIIVAAALAPTTDRGHTAMDEFAFFERMIAAGALDVVDMLAIQPLGFGYRSDDAHLAGARLSFQRAAAIRRRLVSAGADDVPLLAVRFGWNRMPNSPWSTVSPDNQRQFAADAVTIAQTQWPWLSSLAWAIDRPQAAPDDPIWGFATDDELLSALVFGPLPTTHMSRQEKSAPLGLVLVGLAAIAFGIWRGRAAARLLPWASWSRHYRARTWPVHLLSWSIVIAAFYFATFPPLVLLLLGAAACLISAVPRHGLWLALALLPLHIYHKEITFLGGTLYLPPTQAAVLAMLPFLASQTRQLRHQRARLQPADWLALGWLALGAAAGVNVWHWPAYWTGLADLVLTPLALYLAVRLLTGPGTALSRRELTHATAAIVLGGMLAALIGLAHWMMGSGTTVDGVRRLVGPHFSPNHTALYLERTLLAGVGLWVALRIADGATVRLGLAGIGLVLCALALILTFSRGALVLGVPLGVASFVFLLNPDRNPRSVPTRGSKAGFLSWYSRRIELFTPSAYDRGFRRWIPATALIAAALAAGLLFLLFFAQRAGNSATILNRWTTWLTTLELWRAHPLLGVGPGGFNWVFPAFIPIASSIDPDLRHPHNLWLETMSMWGILGLGWLAFLLVVVAQAGNALRQVPPPAPLRWLAAGLLAGLVAGLAHAQVDAYQALADIAGWNWAAIGLLAGAGWIRAHSAS